MPLDVKRPIAEDDHAKDVFLSAELHSDTHRHLTLDLKSSYHYY